MGKSEPVLSQGDKRHGLYQGHIGGRSRVTIRRTQDAKILIQSKPGDHDPGSTTCRYRGNGGTMGVVRRGAGNGASPVVCCWAPIGRGGGCTAVLACAFSGDVRVIMRIIWS